MLLRDYLAARNETAAAFARRIGTNKMAVGRWLAGAIPRGENLQIVIRGTGNLVSLDVLIAANQEAVGKGVLPPDDTDPPTPTDDDEAKAAGAA